MIRMFMQAFWLLLILCIHCFGIATDHSDKKLKIAFMLDHFSVRGTEVATFEYADYNEKILGNESFIILLLSNKYFPEHLRNDQSSEVENVFANRFKNDHFFKCISIRNVNRVLQFKDIDMVYWQVGGGRDVRYDQLAKKTAIHAVFDFVPQGHAFAAISKWLSESNPKYKNISTVPYIVHPPEDRFNTLHDTLHIPKDAVVFGRHGGYNEFNISFAKEAVIELASEHKDWYFLFLNTKKFCELPNVIFLEKTWDYHMKERFINTCDAMLHAREGGETFGLAVAEFSIRNKPVVTFKSYEAAHLEILGNKALIYTSKQELVNYLEYCANHREEIRSMDWDAYSKDYNPETVMKQFNDVFILPLTHLDSDTKKVKPS